VSAAHNFIQDRVEVLTVVLVKTEVFGQVIYTYSTKLLCKCTKYAMKATVVFCFLAKFSANALHFQILSTL
jgi:hypothetical protein